MHSNKTLNILLLLSLCCVLTWSSVTPARVFKKIQPDGTVVYSDEPSPGAEEIEVKPLPSYNLPPVKPSSTPRTVKLSPPEEEEKGYKSFAITSPTHDSTINHGSGIFSVTLSSKPSLKEKHKIQVMLDGKPVGPASRSSVFNLSNVDRGMHTLTAKIVDEKGKPLISSQPVTIHMRRPTVK